jgi:hypothetical protein
VIQLCLLRSHFNYLNDLMIYFSHQKFDFYFHESYQIELTKRLRMSGKHQVQIKLVVHEPSVG